MTSPDQIGEEARRLFGEPNKFLSSSRQLRFGKKGSLAVELAGEKAGVWFDHEAQKGGHIRVAGDEPYQRPPPRRAITHDSESAPSLSRALDQMQQAAGTAAERYLNRRGITDWPAHSIRFCRNPYGLIGLAQDAAGTIRAAQVVYLTDCGHKAGFAVPKRTFTACSGWHRIAAVHLPGRGEPILCEGIETGLSIWGAIEPRRPVLVCIGIAGLRELRTPQKRITIARDGDAPDSPADRFVKSAVETRARFQRVRVAAPPLGQDFNDVLQQAGPAEVARIIGAAT
jgi:hypothetical protein